MKDPKAIDMRDLPGSPLMVARFERIGQHLLTLSGTTHRGVLLRLGTVVIGFDGTLTPIWAPDRELDRDTARALLLQIKGRLRPGRPRRREQVR